MPGAPGKNFISSFTAKVTRIEPPGLLISAAMGVIPRLSPGCAVLLAHHFLVSGEGKEGPAIPIHVVFEVENFREAGAGGFEFGPTTVAVVSADEVIDAADEAGAIGIAEGAESHDGPRGLGGGAGTLALENGIVVGVAAFAPTAIGMLHALEPVARFEQPGFLHVPIEGAQ